MKPHPEKLRVLRVSIVGMAECHANTILSFSGSQLVLPCKDRAPNWKLDGSELSRNLHALAVEIHFWTDPYHLFVCLFRVCVLYQHLQGDDHSPLYMPVFDTSLRDASPAVDVSLPFFILFSITHRVRVDCLRQCSEGVCEVTLRIPLNSCPFLWLC